MQPQATAVLDGATGRKHTYGQLQRTAVAVAGALSSRVAPGSAVAVALPRSFELIASLLGAMLAGCTWVYLDPSYPGQSTGRPASAAAQQQQQQQRRLLQVWHRAFFDTAMLTD
jgi:acyl-CoA synthetase (AMP-forming)/AMP-acid ligase II